MNHLAAKSYDFLAVGCGFAGAVCAERLASSGHTVLVMDKRPHVGGNAHDEADEHGVLVHTYGPHIFHTNSHAVFSYLSRFTSWHFYEHRVLAEVNGMLVPIPINRLTLNALYGLQLDQQGAAEFLAAAKEPRERIETSEDVALSSVGRDLCEKIFRNYTRKQWGHDLSELSAGVAARIPTRTNDDDRYFTDTFQGVPANGCDALFRNLLQHSNITLSLNTDFHSKARTIKYGRLIYTGRIDAFYGYRFGALPYRSLRFEYEHSPSTHLLQRVGTINYPNTNAFTRTTEMKRLTGQPHSGTTIIREYPSAAGEPYYPVPQTGNERLCRQYKKLARCETRVNFVGRLAEYRYYNMDQVVASALRLCKTLTS